MRDFCHIVILNDKSAKLFNQKKERKKIFFSIIQSCGFYLPQQDNDTLMSNILLTLLMTNFKFRKL